MKTIRLRQITNDGSSYAVILGNGTSNSFSSKRQADSFLFNTNLFLSSKLHALHKIYCEVWNSYQENWFYFNNDRKTPKFALREIERSCAQNLDAIDRLFNLAIDRCGLTNGNYFVFIHFDKIADYLEDTIRLLAGVYGKHSNTNAICKMDINIRYVMLERTELSNFAKYAGTKIFKIPAHLSEQDKSYIPENLSIVA